MKVVRSVIPTLTLDDEALLGEFPNILYICNGKRQLGIRGMLLPLLAQKKGPRSFVESRYKMSGRPSLKLIP